MTGQTVQFTTKGKTAKMAVEKSMKVMKDHLDNAAVVITQTVRPPNELNRRWTCETVLDSSQVAGSDSRR